MKKIYSLLVAALLICSAASAKTVNLRVTLTSPAQGATLTVGTSFNQHVVVTNLGPGAIAPADTFFYQDPSNASGQVWLRVGLTKAVNDTIVIDKTLTISNATNGPATYCVLAYASNGASIVADSDYFANCHGVTIAGGTTGITNMVVKESVQNEVMNVFPNPATGSINLDYKAKNATEVNARIIDLTGREVMSVNMGKAYVGQTGYKLDISNLTTGIYFVELRQEGVRAVGRISKQ